MRNFKAKTIHDTSASQKKNLEVFCKNLSNKYSSKRKK